MNDFLHDTVVDRPPRRTAPSARTVSFRPVDRIVDTNTNRLLDSGSLEMLD